jgi:hypothetical protein
MTVLQFAADSASAARADSVFSAHPGFATATAVLVALCVVALVVLCLVLWITRDDERARAARIVESEGSGPPTFGGGDV